MDDALHEEFYDSSICTKILGTWPKLSKASQDAKLGDLNIDRISHLALLALTRSDREALLLAVRREVAEQVGDTSAPRPKRKTQPVPKTSRRTITYDPWSYGHMG